MSFVDALKKTVMESFKAPYDEAQKRVNRPVPAAPKPSKKA